MMGPYRFATAGETLLAPDRAKVFFDGTFSEPRLAHPEGVAVGPDGWIWCGTERGEILRIAPDASAMERVASTDGFALGLAFDGDRRLFVCDLKHATVFALDLATRALTPFAGGGIKIPNYPVVDHAHGRLLVSDSFAADRPGPGIWAFDLATGTGGLWYDAPLVFANGLALGGGALFVCETFARRVLRIEIAADGSAGAAAPFVEDLPGLPDGIAFDGAGNLVVACYEPSRLLRVSPNGRQTDVLIEDPTAHLFCHPTNIAFDGNRLFSANLGRWHITEVAMDIGAPPLWQAATEMRPES